MNILKLYQSAIFILTNPLQNYIRYNLNLFCHTLNDRSKSQGCNLENGYIVNIPSHTNVNITKDMIFNNIQIESNDTEQWDKNKVVNQSTQLAQNNHISSECFKCSLNDDMKKHILPNVTYYQIVGITISALLFNVIMIKSEAAFKANMHNIKINIQDMDINIKGINIDHFHEHIDYLTTSLVAYVIIMPDLMHHLFKAYKVCEDSDFREYLT